MISPLKVIEPVSTAHRHRAPLRRTLMLAYRVPVGIFLGLATGLVGSWLVLLFSLQG